jgi:hypothetical protein
VGGSFLSDVQSSDKEGGGQPTWCGDDHRQPVTVRGERGHREQGGAQDRTTVPGGQNGNGPPTGGPAQQNIISNFQTPLKLANTKRKPSPIQKIFILCMRLCLHILNNFLNWVDFKFSTEFML